MGARNIRKDQKRKNKEMRKSMRGRGIMRKIRISTQKEGLKSRKMRARNIRKNLKKKKEDRESIGQGYYEED